MSDNSAEIQVSANVDGLLDSLKTARTALDSTFDMQRIAGESQQRPVSDLFRTIEHSSDQAIRNMIRGTQTWQSALSNMAMNIEVRFAQMAARKALSWMQSEQLMTGATKLGNDERLVSDKKAGGEGIASIAQYIISAILNDAKRVFSGIFSFLAPFMGPAAAGPASAGSALVAGMAGGVVSSYEVGSWHIPQNELAFLHEGEMVVPKPFADSLRNAGGFGGGDSYSITIRAIDTQSGARFLKNNAASIASAISGQVRNFNSKLPAWKS